MIFEDIETDLCRVDESDVVHVTASIHPQRFTTKPTDRTVIGQIKQSMVVESGTLEDLAHEITLSAGSHKDGTGAHSCHIPTYSSHSDGCVEK